MKGNEAAEPVWDRRVLVDAGCLRAPRPLTATPIAMCAELGGRSTARLRLPPGVDEDRLGPKAAKWAETRWGGQVRRRIRFRRRRPTLAGQESLKEAPTLLSVQCGSVLRSGLGSARDGRTFVEERQLTVMEQSSSSAPTPTQRPKPGFSVGRKGPSIHIAARRC